tara:strand:- start:1494 stop:1682 length:189 start_codon:yes stop_codon:yes gene_type:complete
MSTKQKIASYSPSTIRERIQDLSVDLEYASRGGDSAYSQHIQKKIQNLYKLLDRITSRGKKV